jgi:hypothetical protein
MDKIKDLYLDFWFFDECIGYVDEKNGHPSIRKCDIFETELDYNPDQETAMQPYLFNKNF